MNLRTSLSKIYHLLQNTNPYIFIFCIGSYPIREESNHENPKILKKLKFFNRPIIKIYIDPIYKKEDIVITQSRVGNDSLICPYIINQSEYNMILEFCHIAGILNNSISIIMEFTGTSRIEYENIENKTPYLYITPSNCLGDTNSGSYNPIIQVIQDKLVFYRPDETNLQQEIIKLSNGVFTQEKLNKLEFINSIIGEYITTVKEIYRLLYNYIERKDCFTAKHKIVFEKNKAFFHPSLKLLKNRMEGYNLPKTENIIDEFLKSETIDFEIYIKDKIQLYISIILLFNNNGDCELLNTCGDSLIFNNSQDVFKIITYLEEQYNVKKSKCLFL
uniref:Uncharacterized protein n=1 Tax=viral metagenome TaxID=1070528 RepID=A0A6C0JBH1_9ZZZZ